MEYKKLTDDELADFLQRACVQLVPELTQQLLSLGMELAEYRAKIPEGAVVLTNDEFWKLSNKFSKKELDEIVEFHKNKTRKETAEKIYKLADEIATGSQNDGVNILCAIKKEFGL